MILYHQTSVKLIKSILFNGLIPRVPDEWKSLVKNLVPEGSPIIWFTDNIREKDSYLHPSKCLVQVDPASLNMAKLVQLTVRGWWAYADSIPADRVRLVSWDLYRKRKPKFLEALDVLS